MRERNANIKEYAKRNGVPLWMVAERYKGGVTDSYFSRLLRKNFTDEEEKEILSIIHEIALEKDNVKFPSILDYYNQMDDSQKQLLLASAEQILLNEDLSE